MHTALPAENGMEKGMTREAGPAVLLVIAAILAGNRAVAAPGDLDPAFGTTGRAIGQYMQGLDAMVGLDSGELVLVGNDGDYLGDLGQNLVLQKFDVEGRALGPSVFVDSGGFDDGAARAVVAPDGKVVVVGTTCCYPGGFNVAVYRFSPDLSLDTSFGGKGFVLIDLGGDEQGEAIVVEPDGSIVVAGKVSQSQENGFGSGQPLGVGIFRLRPDGSQDAASAVGPLPDLGPGDPSVAALLRDMSGRFLLATNHRHAGMNLGCRVTRLTPQGTVDPTFAMGGTLELMHPGGEPVACEDIVQRESGQLIVVGSSWRYWGCDGLECSGAVVAAVSPDGELDESFNGGFADVPRIGTWNDLHRVQLDETGNALVLGSVVRDPRQEYCGMADVVVGRVKPDGTLDPHFGTYGVSLLGGLPANRRASGRGSLLLDPQGRILLGMSYRRTSGSFAYQDVVGAVARLLASGSGPGVVEFDECERVRPESDGMVRIAVRRTAGGAGTSGVTYRTVGHAAGYTAVSGALVWSDGDVSPRTIELSDLRDVSAVVLENFMGSVAGVTYFPVDLGHGGGPLAALPPELVPNPPAGGGGSVGWGELLWLGLTMLTTALYGKGLHSRDRLRHRSR